MPADATFRRLHDIIQNAMGFQGGYPCEYHLYAFELPEENLRVTNDEEAYDTHKHYKKVYGRADLSSKGAFERKMIENIMKQLSVCLKA